MMVTGEPGQKGVGVLKIVGSETMKEADRMTNDRYGMTGAVLMEMAGTRTVEFIMAKFPQGGRVVVLAGPGNNGGDGLVAARLLEKAGFKVSLWCTVKAGAYRAEAGANEKYLIKSSYPIQRILTQEDLGRFAEDVTGADLLVDALLGVGVNRKVEGLLAEVIGVVNQSAITVLAVDVPSGVNADSGLVMGAVLEADWTVTFSVPKLGLMLYPGALYSGEVVVGDIGVPHSLFDEIEVDLITSSHVREMLPGRPMDSHKGSLGRVLIVAGSPGMTGAAALTAESALQGGAGLVYLAAPESVCPALEAKLLEVIIIPLPESSPGIIDPVAAEKIIDFAGKCDALAIGPGLDPGEDTATLLYNVIHRSPVPLVLDAGALEGMRGKMQMLQSARFTPVITPHPGEMARLAGIKVEEVQSNRLTTALRITQLWNCLIVLKGANSIIADPNGRLAINPTGGPALSTAGSGDLLTGLITSFIAQGLSSENACKAGSFMHGLAGDMVQTGRGHMAREIMNCYKKAFHYLNEADECVAGNPFLRAIRPHRRGA